MSHPTRATAAVPRHEQVTILSPLGKIALALLNGIAAVFSFLGPAVRWATAWTVACIAFDVLRIRRKVVLANLHKAMPQLPRNETLRTARASYAHFMLTCLEFIGSRRIFPRTKIIYEGASHLDSALAQGKGVYVLVIHLGNWELLSYLGSTRFAQVNIVTKKVGTGAVTEWVECARAQNRMREIDRTGGAKATTQMNAALRAGEMVGVIVDQRRRKGAALPLFGHMAWTNTSLAQLALRTPAPIIPMFLERLGKGNTHRMVIWPEFALEKLPNAGFKEQVLHNSARINEVVEKMVLTRPEQYFWFHKRWKEAGKPTESIDLPGA